MLRPYLAIIVDSFREALVSRVLWVLLGLISFLLLILAPAGYRDAVTIHLSEGDVADWPGFVQVLRDAAAHESPSPARRIVSLLDEKTQRSVRDFALPAEGDFDGAMQFIRNLGAIRGELNRVIERPELYDPSAWSELPSVSDELQQLLNKSAPTLSSAEVGRRNRLLLEAAFPDWISPSPPLSFQLRYLVWDVFEPLPFRPEQFRRGLDGAVGGVTSLLVGVIGVFVAILVTSSIIPQMFDPGQLHLLLSKPISRSLLFLARFIGGCAFILLNASYLIGGMWLILGCRFHVWNHRVLLAIPIYLFMFAVYFTVSALAGILWRNAIISIAVTILFWLTCFGIGSAKSGLETFYVTKRRMTQLVDAQDTLVAVNEMGFASAWNENTGQWDEIFVTDVQKQLRPAMVMIPTIPPEMKPLGLAYDSSRGQLIGIQRSIRNGQMTTYVGARANDWRSVNGVPASLGALYLLREPDGRLLVVSTTGLYRLTGDPLRISQPVKLFGVTLPLPSADAYQSVGPNPPLLLSRSAAAAIHPETGELAVCFRGKLTLLSKSSTGEFSVRREVNIDEEQSPLLIAALGGPHVLVGRDDGRLLLLDGASGEQRQEFRLPQRQAPRQIVAANDGRWFAILSHDLRLWLLTVDDGQLRQAPVTGQGDISAILLRADQRLLVADRSTRVTEYSVPDFTAGRRWSPPASLFDSTYRYAARPLYTLFPKPGELSNTVKYLMSGQSTVADDVRNRQAPEASRTSLDPWSPVWSSGAFMLVMLALGCLYLEWQEF